MAFIFIKGSKIRLRNLVYDPPRSGPTLWEIGIPDRTAAEFFVPDPNPSLLNQLYVLHPDKYGHFFGHYILYYMMYDIDLCLNSLGLGSTAYGIGIQTFTLIKI